MLAAPTRSLRRWGTAVSAWVDFIAITIIGRGTLPGIIKSQACPVCRIKAIRREFQRSPEQRRDPDSATSRSRRQCRRRPATPSRRSRENCFRDRNQCTMLRVTDPPEPSCEAHFKILISSHKRTELGAELCGARTGPRAGSPSAVASDICAGVMDVRGKPPRCRRAVAVLPCARPKNADVAVPLPDALAYIGTTIHAAATARRKRRYFLTLVSLRDVDVLISELPIIEVSDCQSRGLRMRCFEFASATPRCQYYMCESFEQVGY